MAFFFIKSLLLELSSTRGLLSGTLSLFVAQQAKLSFVFFESTNYHFSLEPAYNSCYHASFFWSFAQGVDWIRHGLQILHIKTTTPLETCLSVLLAEYWLALNAMSFGNPMQLPSIVSKTLANTFEVLSLSYKPMKTAYHQFVHVKWHPPEVSLFNLSCDGSVIGNSGSMGAGAIICNCYT